jgi:hypothetical protein
MHFSFLVLLRINSLYMFRALFALHQEALHIQQLVYIYIYIYIYQGTAHTQFVCIYTHQFYMFWSLEFIHVWRLEWHSNPGAAS